jgi:hypothetical protein
MSYLWNPRAPALQAASLLFAALKVLLLLMLAMLW